MKSLGNLLLCLHRRSDFSCKLAPGNIPKCNLVDLPYFTNIKYPVISIEEEMQNSKKLKPPDDWLRTLDDEFLLTSAPKENE